MAILDRALLQSSTTRPLMQNTTPAAGAFSKTDIRKVEGPELGTRGLHSKSGGGEGTHRFGAVCLIRFNQFKTFLSSIIFVNHFLPDIGKAI